MPSTYNTVTHGSEKGSESWFMDKWRVTIGGGEYDHVVYVPKGSRIENM